MIASEFEWLCKCIFLRFPKWYSCMFGTLLPHGVLPLIKNAKLDGPERTPLLVVSFRSNHPNDCGNASGVHHTICCLMRC